MSRRSPHVEHEQLREEEEESRHLMEEAIRAHEELLQTNMKNYGGPC